MLFDEDLAVVRTSASVESSRHTHATKMGTTDVGNWKFKRLEPNKFKVSLEYIFDKQSALEKLRWLYANDPEFFATEFVTLALLIRKFFLKFEDLSSVEVLGKRKLVPSIYKCLEDGCNSNAAEDERKLYFLSLSLKYLIRNSDYGSSFSILPIPAIAQLIEICKSSSIKTELVTLVAYLVEKSNERLSEYGRDKLKSLVLDSSELTQDIKSFFCSKLEAAQTIRRQCASEMNQKDDDYKFKLAATNMKKHQQVVTKTIQTVKSKYDKKKSEETDFTLLNLKNCVKNRNRRKIYNAIETMQPIIKRSDGNNQAWYRDTWNEMMNLYSLVSQNQTLKTDDKDNYLPDKFLGEHYIRGIKRSRSNDPLWRMYSYFINRACASIFFKVSRRQELNNKVINKLFKCITDFDSLVSVLNITNGYVDMFINQVFIHYWKMKKMAGPDIIDTFVKDFMNRTTEEYEERGWIWNSTKVRMKAFNRANVEKIITKEINQVRRDAIRTIYNCAFRNKTILTKNRIEQIRACLKIEDRGRDDSEFSTYVFRILELAETLEDFDYAEVFRSYIRLLTGESSVNSEAMLRFINNQAKDLKRSQELFNDHVFRTLVGLLRRSSTLSSKLKVHVLEIINNYLEHETTKSMSDDNLTKLLNNVFESNVYEIVYMGMTSLRLIADKDHRLSPNIIKILMTHFELPYTNEKRNDMTCEAISSHIILILTSAICAENESVTYFLRDIEDLERVSSKLQCDHIVVLDDNGDEDWMQIKFEKSSAKNAHDSSNRISLLAAKIILKSTENKVLLSEDAIDNLILSLNNSNEDDKQTKIVASKCLYNASKYLILQSDDLKQMLQLINSDVYDVGVYIHAAYLEGCVRLVESDKGKCLDPIHLDNISSLYAPESLQLGMQDYESEINRNLFKILFAEARKQIFSDHNLFLLFDSILNFKEKYTTEILEILIVYTSMYNVPETTVRMLENALGFSEHFQKTLTVLKNLIVSSQVFVTRKTLITFIDQLYNSTDTEMRLVSLKMLENVRQYQELDDDIFWKFELAKAGYALEFYAFRDKLPVIEFIQTKTKCEMQLPIDTKHALEKEISRPEVLKIFANISKNGQIIELNLFDKLITMFDPINASANDVSIILINIFENAAKNNQALPQNLLNKLESALCTKVLEHNVLPVFIYMAQKGERLSKCAIDKLVDRLLIEDDPVVKQGLLSALGSLVASNIEERTICFAKVNRILIRELRSGNFNIQRLCIMVIGRMAIVTKRLDDQLLQQLIEIGTNSESSNTVRSEICSLFDSFEDQWNSSNRIKIYRDKLKLANLSCNSVEDLLFHLDCLSYVEDGFLQQNYNQLKQIIDNEESHFQERALDILHTSKSKSRMTDELLESVAALHMRTMSPSIKESCLQLIKEAAENGKNLTNRCYEIWTEEINGEHNIKKFFHSKVYENLKELHLDHKKIKELLSLIKRSEKLSDLSSLSDLIELMVKENSDFFKNQSFVCLIEQCLLKKTFIETAMPCYCRIIKEKRYRQVEEVLKAIASYFNENLNYSTFSVDLLIQAVTTMYFSCKFVRLPDECLKLLENNLQSRNAIIRGFSFRTRRLISNDGRRSKPTKFDECCDQLIRTLAQYVDIKIDKSEDNLDLMETFASVWFIDVSVFKTNSKDTWNRELLSSSIFESFNVHQIDQQAFYRCWFQIENIFHTSKVYKILSIIQVQKFQSFDQVVEVISLLPEMSYENVDDVVRMLDNYGPSPYEGFKREWCMRKIKTRITNSDAINRSYLNELVEILCSKFDVYFIGKLIRCIKSIDRLRAFEELIDFCSKEKVELDDLEIENVELNEFKCVIEAKQLCTRVRCQPQHTGERKTLQELLRYLLNEGWNYPQLDALIAYFKLSKLQHLQDLLNTIHRYNLSSASNLEKCKHILNGNTNFTEVIRQINKLAIENHFQLNGKIKDLQELLAEMRKSNSANQWLVEYMDTSSLDIRKQISHAQTANVNWNEDQILSWARKMKQKEDNCSDYEAIGVVLRANFLATGHTLTDTQILCTLIALKTEGNLKGKLLEVATGEGKSTIICILAIINALRGKKVDIITSSPVLAERDAKQKEQLYKMFTLTCAHNSETTVYLKGAKDCYKADVVYGEMSQFQFDMLRDNYSKLGTLGGRRCAVAIVDEVDSMLIDDSSKISRLSSTIAGMDHFQAVYVHIWDHLISITKNLIMFDNKLYRMNGKIDFENENTTLEYLDTSNGNNNLKISDQRNTADISQIGEVVDGDVDIYLRKSLGIYLDRKINDGHFFIPGNFSEFFQRQKSRWICNAIEALCYQKDVHYVVQDGQIKPVDYYSTGIVQSSTNWSDGLHQFLQLKHNLKMTSETLTTNFLSNIGFMRKYDHIYGLTGTLGSETARNVLKKVYEVELINIPQGHQKQYLELEPIVVNGEVNWMKEITSNTVLEVKKERGILIICETISHANMINKILKNKLRSSAVKLYTMNDMNQEKVVERISPGEVIIATNLAGRGTDIQTDEIEDSGGLHMILTFLPNNQRVEDQAFGRTARQGKRGTGLMILNADSLIGYTNTTTKESIMKQRDAMETNRLKEFVKTELKLIQVKDKLFDTFCAFLNNEIRCAIRKKDDSIIKKAISLITETQPTVYESNVLAAVEEQWAFFLRRLDDGEIKCEDAEKKYRELIDQLRYDFKNECLIKNPYCYISIAYDILINEWSIKTSSKANRALDCFKKAIKLEERQTTLELNQNRYRDISKTKSWRNPKQEDISMTASDNKPACGAAHYGVAWCLILLKEKDYEEEEEKEEKDYKEEALKSFKSALDCLSDEMSQLNTMQILLMQNQEGFENSDLYKQLIVKTTILGSYLSGIQNNMDAIKRSMRLVDLVATKKYKESSSIIETVKSFNDLERNEQEKTEFKSTDVKLRGEESYSISFNHLTAREDIATIDQALITLHGAFDQCNQASTNSQLSRVTNKTCALDNSYNDLRIMLKNEDLARIYTSDIVIKEGNKNEINQLFVSKNDWARLIKLNIDFDNLNQDTVKAKLSSVKFRSVDIEFVINKSNLLKLIEENDGLSSGTLLVSDRNWFEKVRRDELLINVNQLNTDDSPCLIKFEDLGFDQAKYVTENCHQNTLFAISFNDVYDFGGSDFDDDQVNFCFDQMNRETAEMVIKVLRKENFEFSLEFNNLTDEQLKHVLQNANLDQEELEVRTKKSLSDMYMSGVIPSLELSEFAAKGIEYVIEINERSFVPWRSVAAVVFLGTCQIIVGAVLVSTGFATTVGLGFLTEGIADLFTAFKAYRNRQFRWSDYCKQKAISIAISAASAGYSTIEKYAQTTTNTLKTSVTGTTNEVIEQAGTQVIYNSKNIGQTVLQTGNKLTSFGLTNIGTGNAIISRCVSFSLNKGIAYLSNFSFELLRPRLCEQVQSSVRSLFRGNGELMHLLRKMNAIDLTTKSNQLQSRVEKIVIEAMNHQHGFIRQHWDSIGSKLLTNIVSITCDIDISWQLNIISSLIDSAQLFQLTDNVVNELTVKLRASNRNNLTINLVLHSSRGINKDRALRIANMMKRFHIFDEHDNFNVSVCCMDEACRELKAKIDGFSNKWRLNKSNILQQLGEETEAMKGAVNKSIDFVRSLHENFANNCELSSFSMIIKSVSDLITDQLIKSFDSQLLQPLSEIAVSNFSKFITDSTAGRLRQKLIEDGKQNSDNIIARSDNYEELYTRLTPEENSNEKVIDAEYYCNRERHPIKANQILFNSD